MSIYGYFVCHDCKQSLWLGKALHYNYTPFAYHIGDENAPKNWDQYPINRIVWKFIADHTSHHIDILLEHDMTEAYYEYQSIGGDTDNDISLLAYLATDQDYYN